MNAQEAYDWLAPKLSTEERKVLDAMVASQNRQMKFAKLIDDKGRQIARPEAVDGSVSFDAKEGKAHAWGPDGKTLLAEMVGARIAWIGAAGIRIEGQEPIDLASTRFRLQAWQVIF